MGKSAFLFFSFICISLISCKSDEYATDAAIDIYQRWEIVDFMSVESVVYPKDNNFSPVIEFKNDGTYSLKLDANSCMGSFARVENDSITITHAGCTKICCDSSFSLKVVEMLSKVKTYELEKNELKLNVPMWGWLTLKLKK